MSTWTIRRVGDMARLINGHPFDSHDFTPTGDVPLVRIRDITAADFETYVPQHTVPQDKVLKDGDVVIGMDGDFNVIRWRRGAAALNQRVCALRDTGVSDLRFLAYALPDHLKVINDLTYSTTVKHLSSGQVTGLRITAPDRDDQGRIADYLDRETATIDALIEKQRSLISGLRERRSAAVEHAVSGFTTSADETFVEGPSWVGSIPSTWRTFPLWAMYRREKRTGFIEEPMVSVFRDFGVVFKADRANLNETAEDRSIYQLVEPGWFVVNRMKAWQGSVGVSSIRGISSGHYLCFRPLHGENHKFLNWLFRSPQYRHGFAMLSRGVRPGQAEIDNDQLRKMPVVLPPLEEQREIADHLDRETAKIDALIAKAERFIELAQERRAALITAAVTGQIEIPTED
ncbi:Type I restriction-modification system specificity subunit [Micrococcus luteus]|uniref:restriction endonuclease subunit S n=1 Tax=Micrococcus TaxID=1269 RepID=UPI0004473B69|nr:MULTISPECIES: restriction endonuclease subunit S [Micrococcus]EZP36096.1 Type I restriction-modification system specificity subunit [Micrococcus luteus]EZP36105.1 Type I restriction-modification system specificity subunit [Micrococcus luteus]MEB2536519.1 restriction endonuclease subunit S [Micrococcus luteus]NHQ57470.1 restriction endonuclease subunit S [Micrococcus luteus]TQF74469.1 restriction endonuclease subunit S [Micrococcus sp. R8502A1]